VECFTCRVVNEPDRPAAIVCWVDELIVVNHTAMEGRAGWFVVSPVRHLTRFFELSSEERIALTDAAAVLDEILTRLYGSTRTLVASLGWFTDDHVHLHVVPTFGTEVSNGHRNFNDAYVAVEEDAEVVAAQVTAEILALKRFSAPAAAQAGGGLDNGCAGPSRRIVRRDEK
jgi:diadenosine tetraphosphate (Ap4A) HIT family hydrolase